MGIDQGQVALLNYGVTLPDPVVVDNADRVLARVKAN